MLEKINGETFFNKLYEDEDFCKQLGKVILSASKLEAQLIKLVENTNNTENKINYNITMGALIGKIDKAQLLPKNTISVLKVLAEQRNYLTHSIFIMLSDVIEDSKLIENIKDDKYIKKNLFKQTSEEKEEFVYDDICVYIERACNLADNLSNITDNISNINKRIYN